MSAIGCGYPVSCPTIHCIGRAGSGPPLNGGIRAARRSFRMITQPSLAELAESALLRELMADATWWRGRIMNVVGFPDAAQYFLEVSCARLPGERIGETLSQLASPIFLPSCRSFGSRQTSSRRSDSHRRIAMCSSLFIAGRTTTVSFATTAWTKPAAEACVHRLSLRLGRAGERHAV